MLTFNSDNPKIDGAFKIAVGDILTNIAPYCSTLNEREYNTEIDLIAANDEVLNAGLDYPTPWTRDAAINTWNGVGLFLPEITKNTLLSVLEKRDRKVILKDEYESQYWDAIIWAVGAWEQFLYTSDDEFLEMAFEVVKNALEFFEATEFDQKRNLFRGPASTSDGVSGYPDFYANAESSGMHGGAFILDWLQSNPEHKVKTGRGMPMFALSTNCLYFQAYVIVQKIGKALNKTVSEQWSSKADQLKKAINNHFWSEELGHYLYLVDDFGNCQRQECLGHAYALAFGIADEAKAKRVIENQTILPGGIPVLWPMFDRHKDGTGNSFGRHCGCIWPSFEVMFTLAAKQYGHNNLFLKQIESLTTYACRDLQFAEIYHPFTGEIYGGVQKFKDDDLYVWKSCSRQTWTATGFLRLILRGLIGMTLTCEGMRFEPVVPKTMSFIKISGLRYNQMKLDIQLTGSGDRVKKIMVNGTQSQEPFLDFGQTGQVAIEMELSE